MKQLFTLALFVSFLSAAQAKRIYVNINAAGLNNGTSWTNAYTDLSVPMDNAVAGDTFWVANGVYTSVNTRDLIAFHGHSSDIALYGGFDGSETQLSQRNYSGHLTILSGTNYFSNGVLSLGGNSLIDGFRITHSLAPAAQRIFTGIQLYMTNNTMANCLITGIASEFPVMVTGVANIINCRFANNQPSAASSVPVGGATIHCRRKSLVSLTDCQFINNRGVSGGCLFLSDSGAAIVNRCQFYGNQADFAGGVVYDSTGSRLRVFNSLFVGNKAPLGGVYFGMDTITSSHSFSHCTIAHNLSSRLQPVNYALWLRSPKDTLRNSIVWEDSTGTGPELPNPKAGALFSRNVIRGGGAMFGTAGTFTFNPMFKSPGKAASAPFASSTNYDYHLSPFSDAIDTASGPALASPYNQDLERAPRAQGRMPDLGAYEWKACTWHNLAITASGPTSFCLPDSVRLTASGNPAYRQTYLWNGGTQSGPSIIVKTSGVHKVAVVDSMGCRAAASVTVNAVAAPVPVISYGAGNTLSVSGTYATYQWYLNGGPISGAIGATYKPSVNGNYMVKVTTTIAGCPGTSAVFNLKNVSVSGTADGDGLRIFPNPSAGYFTISMDNPLSGELFVTVVDMLGREVWHNRFDQSGGRLTIPVHLGDVAKGLYTVVMNASDVRIVKRVVIE